LVLCSWLSGCDLAGCTGMGAAIRRTRRRRRSGQSRPLPRRPRPRTMRPLPSRSRRHLLRRRRWRAVARAIDLRAAAGGSGDSGGYSALRPQGRFNQSGCGLLSKVNGVFGWRIGREWRGERCGGGGGVTVVGGVPYAPLGCTWYALPGCSVA